MTNYPFHYQFLLNCDTHSVPRDGTVGSYGSIDFANQTAIGTYTVVATNTFTGCTNTMKGDATISYSNSPLAGTLTKSPNVAGVCIGTDVSATATPGSGGGSTAVDVLEYRFDGAGTWTAYTSGAILGTTGHSLVEIR